MTARAEDAPNDWQSLVSQAFNNADLVVSGTVQAVDNQTAVDGGHVYTIAVGASHKGTSAESVTVRAGGWLYTVILALGEETTFFLRDRNRQHFSVVEADQFRPMVFRHGTNAIDPSDQRLDQPFSGVRNADLSQLLRQLASR